MVKRAKSKPGSPTELVSTNVTRVQDNASESPMMDQEMNKPFALVLSVPHNSDLSAIFPCVTIETGIFPVDRDDDAMHTLIVDKITDMTCKTMKTYFTVTSKIQDCICCLVKDNYKCDATGKEYFRFLMSQHPSNYNMAIAFAGHLSTMSLNRIPFLVVSFECVHPRNSSTISWILCVLHLKTIPATNSLTRLIPSFLQISMEPLSSESNPVLLRNGLSPRLHVKEWMTNGTVLLPILCQVIPQIPSLFRTWTVMNVWMLPKFRTMFWWIWIKAPRICPKTTSVLNLTVTRTSCLQWLTGAIQLSVFSPRYSLIQILLWLQAIFCNW